MPSSLLPSSSYHHHHHQHEQQQQEEQRRPVVTEYRILALYRFISLISPDEQTLMKHPERHPRLAQLQSELYTTLRRYETRGTLLLAPEGINGTICYPYPPPPPTRLLAAAAADQDQDDNNANVAVAVAGNYYDNEDDDPVKSFICNHPLFGGEGLRTRSSVWKENQQHDDDDDDDVDDDCNNNNNDETTNRNNSYCNNTHQQQQQQGNNRPQQAFQRLKIKIKPEIVTLGLGRPIISNNPIIITPTNAIPTVLLEKEQQRHVYNQKANPNITKGTYLNSRQWDEAMKNPNVLVIDTRNSYEIDIGSFESAIDPQTKHFSEFPEYLERLADEFDWSKLQNIPKQGEIEDMQQQEQCDAAVNGNGNGNGGPNNNATTTPSSSSSATSVNNEEEPAIKMKKKKPPPTAIAMFCTGGIRCEKATSYALQSNLFPQNLPIYHLEGGILSYLDDVAKRGSDDDTEREEQEKEGGGGSSTFHGECFVFDKRVALTEGLEPSNKFISCHGCRGPMDRRLLEEEEEEEIDNDNDGATCADTGNDNNSTNMEEEEKKKKEYEQLLMGIRNLPPLSYDSNSQRWYVKGLTCPRCHDGTTRESFERFAQRKEQMEICAREGKSHFQDNGRK